MRGRHGEGRRAGPGLRAMPHRGRRDRDNAPRWLCAIYLFIYLFILSGACHFHVLRRAQVAETSPCVCVRVCVCAYRRVFRGLWKGLVEPGSLTHRSAVRFSVCLLAENPSFLEEW